MKYRFAPGLIALLAIFACSRPETSPANPAGAPASTISTADPATVSQLTRGFYDLDHNTWRWTQKNFSVTLGAPRRAPQEGARLALRFTLPDVLLEKLKSITVSATVNGIQLPSETFARTGEHIYRQDVPAQAFRDNPVPVDFSLDKALPPNPGDNRELGIIVSEIGFEAK